ncbi:L,D-transpeptidase catalytic domain [Allochromatium warmingii]|uniref:L,D-transpeptidase catalytic domain n=1 Tax=Allochromatium warmingii TaxID=61595 RepID=A0A1H3D977_ALLWA|nr:L,D-transpeptidase [Allochromatium warmingii]SDX63003.1 L,D-transpeptidase catalytic domain [Allochromatium warmingii]
MTTSSTLRMFFTSASFKTGIGLLIAWGLVGCDSLSRLTMRSAPAPTETVVEEAPAVAPEPLPTTAAPPEVDNIAAELEKESKNTKLSSPLYEWKGDGRKITRIVVNTTEQKARFYAGDEQVGWSTVATGLPKYPTPTGRFQVSEKVENKRSNLYGKVYGKGGRVLHSSAKRGRDAIPAGARFEGARMPFFMRLTEDGVGLHAGPIPNPGQPASHGCIRMPSKLAPVLFKHVSHGTPVTIEGKGPNYGDYVARQRANATRRVAAQRAATAAPKSQPAAKPQPTPTVAAKPKQPVVAAAESHAVAKAPAVVATPTLDPANTRETRLLEPTPAPAAAEATANAPTPTAEAARVQPFAPPVPPAALTPTPAPAMIKPEPAATAALPPAPVMPVTPPPAAPSAPQPAPRTESIPLTLPPPKPAAVAPAPTPAAPPAVEIVEAPATPAPVPKPVEASAPAPAPAPTPTPAPAPKPAEPAPAPASAPAPAPAP